MQTGKPGSKSVGYDDGGNLVEGGQRDFPPQPELERQQAENQRWYSEILPDANAPQLRIAVVRYAGFATGHEFETSTPQRGYEWLKSVAPPAEAAAYHAVVAQARRWAQTPTATATDTPTQTPTTAPGVVLYGLPGRGKSALAATLLVDLVATAFRTQHPDVTVPEPMEYPNRQWQALLDAYRGITAIKTRANLTDGRQYCGKGTTPCVYFASWVHMARIAMSYERRPRQALQRRLARAHAVVLDDVREVESATRKEYLSEILERVEIVRKRLIVTTNLDLPQWTAQLGGRVATRLVDPKLFELIPMTEWRSMRGL